MMAENALGQSKLLQLLVIASDRGSGCRFMDVSLASLVVKR
jgi:hypothetical protein